MRSTAPLSEDYPSDWDWFGPIARIIWSMAFGVIFDAWQEDLFRRVMEVYPEGHRRAGQLRYRQVVISMGRQNGKTEIAAMLGIWALLRAKRQTVIGIASSVDQARIVYDRALMAVMRNPSLAKRFHALTDTRGIRAKDGGSWQIKAAKSGALQGLPIATGIVDEIHLLTKAKKPLWYDLVSGCGSRDNTVVIGITTAGDEESELLLELYALGEAAMLADPEANTFGFFLWEAEMAAIPEDDDELWKLLMQANPAAEEGRTPRENMLSDVRGLPEPDAIRYRLNRFVSSTNSFLPANKWSACARGEAFPQADAITFGFDRTPDWGFATVTANFKDEDGVIHTEAVASLVRPNLEQLVRVAARINANSANAEFVMDSYSLKELGAELKRRGMTVRLFTQGDVMSASSVFYAKVIQRKLKHSSDPLLSIQIPRTIRKNTGESFRISRKDSGVEIDAVMSTVLGVYGADIRVVQELQVF